MDVSLQWITSVTNQISTTRSNQVTYLTDFVDALATTVTESQMKMLVASAKRGLHAALRLMNLNATTPVGWFLRTVHSHPESPRVENVFPLQV